MTWPALRWPAPALLAWALAWLLAVGMQRSGWPGAEGLVIAMLAPIVIAVREPNSWRRVITMAGFPVSWLALHAGAMPAWIWLVALALLLLAYPARAWRDAPFFPTRRDALLGLRERLELPPSPRVLDAGCGAGDGLIALRAAWPDARCDGVEWSAPFALLSRLRCPRATIRRGDLWADDWSGYDLVYLFQRPESMSRAWDKACAQMRDGTWLVSLEFVVPGVAPTLTIEPEDPSTSLRTGVGRAVHAWCIRHEMQPQTSRTTADNPGRPRRLGRLS